MSKEHDAARKHKWNAYFRIKQNPHGLKEIDFINKVVFHLHETFKNPTVVRTTAPFSYECVGSFYFDIEMEIHWKDKLNYPFTRNTWKLEFVKGGA